jgi:hypothetical protein
MASAETQHGKLSIDDVIDEIAEIAGIPNEHRELFRCKLNSIIQNATDFHKSQAPVASKRIAERLAHMGKLIVRLQSEPEKAGRLTERLQNELEKTEWPVRVILDCGLNKIGGISYESVRANLRPNLRLLSRATQWSVAVAKRPAHRPAGITTVFDVVVFQLLIAHICHGKNKLTIYDSKHAEGRWDGRLLHVVGLLRPILPEGLVPKGHLGNALKRIAELFKAAILKHFSVGIDPTSVVHRRLDSDLVAAF